MFTENFSDFFDVDELAETVLIGESGSEVSISAIFDDEHYEVDDTLSPVSTSQPMFQCADTDLTGVQQNDRVVARGVVYKIMDFQPDGTGITKVLLRQV